MEDRERKNYLPCVVDEGILYQQRDMARVLRDLGSVRYSDFQDGVERCSGEGCVMSVSSNGNAATVVANGRIYINTCGFDYLRLGKEGESAFFELIEGKRSIRLVPLGDPSEIPTREPNSSSCQCSFDRFFEDSLAEAFLDDEDEED